MLLRRKARDASLDRPMSFVSEEGKKLEEEVINLFYNYMMDFIVLDRIRIRNDKNCKEIHDLHKNEQLIVQQKYDELRKHHANIKELTEEMQADEIMLLQEIFTRDIVFKELKRDESMLCKGLLISICGYVENLLQQYTLILKEFLCIEQSIDDVCPKDKGSIRFIKFLEKGCGIDLKRVKESKLYSDFNKWLKVRNHLVHNGGKLLVEKPHNIENIRVLGIALDDNVISLSSNNIDSLLSLIDSLLANIVVASWSKLYGFN